MMIWFDIPKDVQMPVASSLRDHVVVAYGYTIYREFNENIPLSRRYEWFCSCEDGGVHQVSACLIDPNTRSFEIQETGDIVSVTDETLTSLDKNGKRHMYQLKRRRE